jgi:putative endonuclease
MWSVYMIRCGDNSLYTGISNDVPKRFEVHQSGSVKAAKYTKNRHPLQLVFSAEKELLITGKTSLLNLGVIETEV